ncbi:hypothetical protein MHYP_G00160690 [Metynnis hypsauchen]
MLSRLFTLSQHRCPGVMRSVQHWRLCKVECLLELAWLSGTPTILILFLLDLASRSSHLFSNSFDWALSTLPISDLIIPPISSRNDARSSVLKAFVSSTVVPSAGAGSSREPEAPGLGADVAKFRVFVVLPAMLPYLDVVGSLDHTLK